MEIPTTEQLIALLEGVNVEKVAQRASVSTKTIYRIRTRAKNSAGDEISPTLDTVRRLVEAVHSVRAEEQAAA